MDLLIDCSSDVAAKAAAQLTKAGCEFKVLAPKSIGGLEVLTTILLPTTLTALQIVVQLWLELKDKKQAIKIFVDGKEFVPTKENIEKLKSGLQ